MQFIKTTVNRKINDNNVLQKCIVRICESVLDLLAWLGIHLANALDCIRRCAVMLQFPLVCGCLASRRFVPHVELISLATLMDVQVVKQTSCAAA